MKAAIYHRYGGSEVLQYEDVERPTPGTGQVLVKVAGTSFNPVDAGIRGGYLTEAFPIALPHVPGIDVAGTIAELGDGMTDWNVGDAVVGLLPMVADGAAADYVLAPAEVLVIAPRSVALADSAALPTVGLTAWQALFDVAALKAGQTILINGAGGAVGGYAVQLAKQAGAVVTATSKAASADRLRRHGADRLIDYLDYAAAPLAVDGQPFDVVLNLVSTTPDETAALADVVADGGFLVGTMTSGRIPHGGFARSGSSSAAMPRNWPASSAVSTPDNSGSTSPTAARWPRSRLCTTPPTPVGCPARPYSFPTTKGDLSPRDKERGHLSSRGTRELPAVHRVDARP